MTATTDMLKGSDAEKQRMRIMSLLISSIVNYFRFKKNPYKIVLESIVLVKYFE